MTDNLQWTTASQQHPDSHHAHTLSCVAFLSWKRESIVGPARRPLSHPHPINARLCHSLTPIRRNYNQWRKNNKRAALIFICEDVASIRLVYSKQAIEIRNAQSFERYHS